MGGGGGGYLSNGCYNFFSPSFLNNTFGVSNALEYEEINRHLEVLKATSILFKKKKKKKKKGTILCQKKYSYKLSQQTYLLKETQTLKKDSQSIKSFKILNHLVYKNIFVFVTTLDKPYEDSTKFYKT